MGHVTWTCGCGQVEARLPATGNRIICYCESCRGFVEKLGQSARLDAWGGNELLQVAPDKVAFLKGAEQLAYTRITEKGPLRWYAACCNTPMANTIPTRALPFSSFQVHDIKPKDALPPLKGQVNISGATGYIETLKRANMPAFIAGFIGGVLKAYLTGGVKKNPFFRADGTPIAKRRDPV